MDWEDEEVAAPEGAVADIFVLDMLRRRVGYESTDDFLPPTETSDGFIYAMLRRRAGADRARRTIRMEPPSLDKKPHTNAPVQKRARPYRVTVRRGARRMPHDTGDVFVFQ